MTTVLIVFGILVGLVLAGILPWALLRKLDGEDKGNDKGKEER